MKTPDLILEQIHSGERAVDNTTAELADSLVALSRSDAEILEAYPAGTMKEAIRAKMKNQPVKPKALVFPAERIGVSRFAALASAACAILLFGFVAVNQLRSVQSGEGMEDRVKGSGARLIVYRKVGETAIPLRSEERVSRNDMLQVSYIAGGDSYGAILSVDGNGVVTQHFPDSGDLAARLDTEGEVSLDFSYRLDDAPKFERFFLITGPEVFSVAGLKQTISRSAIKDPNGKFNINDRLPGQAHAADILLRK